MKIVNPELITNKRVLLRYDIDVPIRLPSVAQGHDPVVEEDFRLKAGPETLNLLLQSAAKVIIIGHIGRPEGKVIEGLKVKPIVDWFRSQGYGSDLESGKLEILENLRFDPREEGCDMEFAKELAQMADIYVNEAFASYRPAVSTTVLPTLLPSFAGLHFAKEVEKLTEVRENPKKPFVVIVGGAKVVDKLPVIEVLAKSADAVLIGGKLVAELGGSSEHEESLARPDRSLPSNVFLADLTEDGFDITSQTITKWQEIIQKAKMIVWNGPVGKFEDPKNQQSAKLAQTILDSGAETVVGGGDTLSLLDQLDLVDKFQDKGFVSTGGGAMLKFLSEGTLPTTKALDGNNSY